MRIWFERTLTKIQCSFFALFFRRWIMDNEKLNSSGCLDKTAFEAIKNVRREERKKLIAEIKELAARYGYEIDCRIDLKEIKEADMV